MLQNVEYVGADSFQNESISSGEFKGISADVINTVEPHVEKINVHVTPSLEDVSYWLSDCLKDAQNVIIEYHDAKPNDKNFVDCAKFFASKTFGVKLQNNGNASDDVNLIKDLFSQSSLQNMCS